MGLPKINQPLFGVTIPSTGKKVQFRPFTVKEEKILLIAQESNDVDQIILAIKQILNNCIEGIDVESLAMFDIEYLLLKIRGQSVNNELKFTIKDPDTEEDVKLTLDINTVEMKRNANESKEIELGEGYKIIMRYATLNELSNIAKAIDDQKTDALFNAMISCIECLVEGEDTVYNFSDFSKEEVTDFVEGLSSATVNKIREFFENVPVLRVEIPYKNSQGKDQKFVVEGMQSFFI